MRKVFVEQPGYTGSVNYIYNIIDSVFASLHCSNSLSNVPLLCPLHSKGRLLKLQQQKYCTLCNIIIDFILGFISHSLKVEGRDQEFFYL